MTVKELITELSMYDMDTTVELSMKVEINIDTPQCRHNIEKQYIFPHGKVYGVQGSTGRHNEVVISGN